MTTPPDITHHEVGGRRLAVRRRTGHAPTLLFLPGYRSDMEGIKATAIDDWAARQGIGCLRFDYSGTGFSDGDFADGTLRAWHDETVHMIDEVAPAGPVFVIGSSMGGWLALSAAAARPQRVAGLIGIAAAPDFTDWGFSDAQKDVLRSEDKLEEPNPYGPEPLVTYGGFWRSGEDMRLLGATIPYGGPARFVHGDEDPTVPWRIAMRAMAQLESDDVQLKLIKRGGHNLSQPHEIDAILSCVDELVRNCL